MNGDWQDAAQLAGYAFVFICIGALCERLGEWYRHMRDIHRLFKRV